MVIRRKTMKIKKIPAEEMVREAFLKSMNYDLKQFEAVIIENNGERTLALLFAKDTDMNKLIGEKNNEIQKNR